MIQYLHPSPPVARRRFTGGKLPPVIPVEEAIDMLAGLYDVFGIRTTQKKNTRVGI
jgi:hypothetical protein